MTQPSTEQEGPRGQTGKAGPLRPPPGWERGKREPPLASRSCFPSESPQPPTVGHRSMEGFISRQRKTKAISPDTNIDEYVYRKPTDWQIKTWVGLVSGGCWLMDLPSQTARPTKYVTTTCSREIAPPRVPLREGRRKHCCRLAGPQGRGFAGWEPACTHTWPVTREERGCQPGKRGAGDAGLHCSVSSWSHGAQEEGSLPVGRRLPESCWDSQNS